MKSIKLLAALAIPAMFAACTSEDIVSGNSQQMNQVPENSELIATGMSINAQLGGADSRLSSQGWEESDLLGLGWIRTAGEQEEDGDLTDDVVYNNLMFQLDPETKMLTTKGSVYKGWHFSYFPFAYQDGWKQLILDINPDVKSTVWNERYSQYLHISNRHFLTKDDLDPETNQLDLESPINPYLAVNSITLTMNADEESAFAKEGELDDLEISAVTLKAKRIDGSTSVFSKYVKIQPTKLPAFDTEAEKDEEEEIVKASLYKANAAEGVIVPLYSTNPEHVGGSSTITTNVDADMLVSGANNKVHTITVPQVAGIVIAKNDVSFTIEVDGGKFIIEYIKDAEEGTCAAINNAAIEAFIEAYEEDGIMTEVGGMLSLDIELCDDNFYPDFTAISSEEEWNNAVMVADALELTADELAETPFVIAKNAEGENWAFENVDGDGNLINLPEAALTVTGEPMVLGAEGEWPAEGLTVNTDVIVKEDLTIADNVTFAVGEGNEITNNAIIKLGVKSTIESVNNENGRIEIVYGSYVSDIIDNKTGVIAYTITGKETAFQLNNLVYYAHTISNVNTLVINKNKKLDLLLKDADTPAGTDPYYTIEGQIGESLVDLDNIDIEMNGGKLYGAAGKSVKNIYVLSGNSNEIKDVNAINLTVEEGASVIVDATMNALGDKPMKSIEENILVDGKLTVKADILCNKISNSGNTIVDDPYTIWYITDYTTGGSQSGKILKYTIATDAVISNNPTDINDAIKDGGDVLMSDDVIMEVTLGSSGNGKAGLQHAGGVFDGGGNILSVPAANTTWDAAVCTSGGTIKNLTIDAGTRGIMIYKNISKVYLENVIFDGSLYTISCDSGSGNDLEATNCIFNGWTSYAATIGDVKFTDCYFGEGAGYAFCRPYAPTEFVNCEFEAGFEIDARAAITFENCTLDGVAVTAANLANLVTYNTANASVK